MNYLVAVLNVFNLTFLIVLECNSIWWIRSSFILLTFFYVPSISTDFDEPTVAPTFVEFIITFPFFSRFSSTWKEENKNDAARWANAVCAKTLSRKAFVCRHGRISHSVDSYNFAYLLRDVPVSYAATVSFVASDTVDQILWSWVRG